MPFGNYDELSPQFKLYQTKNNIPNIFDNIILQFYDLIPHFNPLKVA